MGQPASSLLCDAGERPSQAGIVTRSRLPIFRIHVTARCGIVREVGGLAVGGIGRGPPPGGSEREDTARHHRQRKRTRSVAAPVRTGGLFLYHGIEKFRAGLSNVSNMFTDMGVPAPDVTAPLTAGIEVVAGALLIAGLFTRLSALSLAAVMAGAILTVKGSGPLLSGAGGVGAELDLAYLVGLLAVALLGPGPLSADHRLGLDEATIGAPSTLSPA